MMERCELAIRIGRQERLRMPIIIDGLPAAGAILDDLLRGFIWEGPITVLVHMPGGVTHIVGRYPANMLSLDGTGGAA